MAVLYPGTEKLFEPRVVAARGGLKDEGLVEGRAHVLEAGFASGDFHSCLGLLTLPDEVNE